MRNIRSVWFCAKETHSDKIEIVTNGAALLYTCCAMAYLLRYFLSRTFILVCTVFFWIEYLSVSQLLKSSTKNPFGCQPIGAQF